MSIGPDPQIGAASTRNSTFAAAFSRGRILSDTVGGASARTVLDIGAYTGETADWFCDLFPSATVWAVEPFPDSFHALVARGNPRVKPFQFAATDYEGSVELFSNAISHTNSIFSINPESRDSVDISRRRAQGLLEGFEGSQSRVEVPARTLDSFAGENGIVDVDLLKIDVQGAETSVLCGSQALLPRVRAILVEVSLYDYYTHSSSIGGVEDLIRPHGFALWSITETSNNPMNGRTDWVELLYRNRHLTDTDL